MAKMIDEYWGGLSGAARTLRLYCWVRRVYYSAVAIDIGRPDPIRTADDALLPEDMPSSRAVTEPDTKKRPNRRALVLAELLRDNGPMTAPQLAEKLGLYRQSVIRTMEQSPLFERDSVRGGKIYWRPKDNG